MKLVELTPFKTEDLELDDDQLRAQCLELLEHIYHEKNKHKTFHVNGGHNESIQVDTYKSRNGWAGRTNIIPSGSYNLDDIVETLTGCVHEGDEWKSGDPTLHTFYEKQYMGKLVESFVILDGAPEPWYCVELNYNIGPLLKRRKFYEYIRVTPPRKTNEDGETKLFGKNSGFIVSVPADIEEIKKRMSGETSQLMNDSQNSQSSVYAQYSSVETISYCKGNEDLVWNMATSSHAGGVVPNFITTFALPSTITKDVSHLLSWVLQKGQLPKEAEIL